MNTTTAETRVTEATLGGQERHVHWGTCVGQRSSRSTCGESVGTDVREASRGGSVSARRRLVVSTYRVDTPITALRNGLIAESQAPSVVRQVLDRRWRSTAHQGRLRSVGSTWGSRPVGIRQGWSADIVAQIVVDHGFSNVSVNAAGDVACRGLQSPDQPWVVGILHPESNTEVVTHRRTHRNVRSPSGLFERGNHIIIDPSPRCTRGSFGFATVIGSDGIGRRAFATALLLEGEDGLRFFAGLSDWSGYLMAVGRASYFGPAFEIQIAGRNPTQRSCDEKRYEAAASESSLDQVSLPHRWEQLSLTVGGICQAAGEEPASSAGTYAGLRMR